ncbi:Maf family protein [Glycomyces buryatensis]|uniref:Nucleoside triphosphate pyrophosphatase n=1 Tax=Glycomyces buryatensis TaxID=2570927 RepID=A0A4S8QHB8_9ACTN|nr:nucleoside triphosphate pyrophosphatase [Glycomyces buryatensis]THV43131.1 septum formation inhibitor Maf [Glycomyces buryatensis]
MTRQFILASASPARRALLTAAGIDPEVIVSGVDERQVMGHDPAQLSSALAEMKAEAVLNLVSAQSLVLGCDSVLHFDGEILGKPEGPEEATSRWKRMRGRSGVLYTGHCLIDVAADRKVIRSIGTTVHFAEASDAEIAAYVATGEPLHVAGSFTLDGYGSAFIDKIEGDPGTVIGLSMPLLRTMLGELEIALTDLWRPNGA